MRKKSLKLLSGLLTASILAGAVVPIPAKAAVENGWEEVDGKYYWYENGVRQGYDADNPDYRGKEIYDPDSDAWYWLDNIQNGAKAVSKDVYQESGAGLWADKLVLNENGDPDPDLSTGKWVRYDESGHMIKGWDTNENGSYYFDLTYGTMAKGYAVVDGTEYYFNAGSGVMERELGEVPEGSGWKTIDGADFWYENGVRQGYSVDASYRGKEIYDPASDAWYWLDNVDGGKKAACKDVYQESEAGEWAENEDGTGKWVRYDENGHMIKGWSTNENGTYYFDPTYGTMAKGVVTIDGKQYEFDENSGVLKGEVQPDDGNGGNTGNGGDDGNNGEGTNDGGSDVNPEGKRNPEVKKLLENPGEVKMTGNYGEVVWTVYDSGLLTVTGECAEDGLLWKEQNTAVTMEIVAGMDYAPWFHSMDDITSAYINVKNVKSLKSLFYCCTKLVNVDLYDLDTSNVTDMSGMFNYCSSLTSLDLSNFDTSQVTKMGDGVDGYLSDKDNNPVSDIVRVSGLDGMFSGCSSLVSLDLSSFDTSQVTDMSGMFSGCNSLTSLDLSNFDTSQVTDMAYMFRDCNSLTSLDLSNFDTSQVTDMGYMFEDCSSMTSLDLRSFDTMQTTDMSGMFNLCKSLTEIKVGTGWNTDNASTRGMFSDCGTSSVTYAD